MEQLLKKLHYKGGRAAILNAPEGYSLGIEADDQAGAAEDAYDFVQLFVRTSRETGEWITKLLPKLNDESVLWITYPKQSAKMETDLNRDVLAHLVQESTPYRAVSIVAVDDKWSALRFRHRDKVKVKTKK